VNNRREKKERKNGYKFEQNPPRPSIQAVTSLMELEGTNGTAYCLPSCIGSSSVNVYLIIESLPRFDDTPPGWKNTY